MHRRLPLIGLPGAESGTIKNPGVNIDVAPPDHPLKAGGADRTRAAPRVERDENKPGDVSAGGAFTGLALPGLPLPPSRPQQSRRFLAR